MDSDLKEVRDRTRRIETRLSKFMEAQGFDIHGQKPEFRDGLLFLPTPNCSIKDCLAAIPGHWDGDVTILVNDEEFATIRLVG